ncbi:MAG: amylo-alpha-1,6-glucosidase [Candidatus Zhuqueibacterota bacterium]
MQMLGNMLKNLKKWCAIISPLIFILLIVLLSCKDRTAFDEDKEMIPELDHLAIDMNPDYARPFVFTNREAAFFYGQANDQRRDGHQGFYVNAIRYIDDYLLKADGALLDRKRAQKVSVYPDRIHRVFPGDIAESLYMIDMMNCFVLELTARDVHQFELFPLLSSAFEHAEHQAKWLAGENMLLLFPEKLGSTPTEAGIVGIKFDCEATYHPEKKDTLLSAIPSHAIGSVTCSTKSCKIFFVVGQNEDEVKQTGQRLKNHSHEYIQQKKQRLIDLLSRNYVETSIPEFNHAFRWALISMDQLIMRQPGAGKEVTGIFAGLPWFNNYWGRDTFISLPGAALVTGRLEEARQILLSFAQFQSQDETSTNFGRIPNQVTTNNIIYNTADGTPWFVRELWEYYLYSGDKELLRSLYDVVKFSIQGTLRYHVDENLFLVHEDAETWMDAVGTEGPWSPRGNRAVDVQALWYQQLAAGSKIAHCLGDSIRADEWDKLAAGLKSRFLSAYWNKKRMSLYDHLNADNTPDALIRPNQIFAITIPDSPLMSPHQELAVLREVVTKLTYRYGVASLWQHDPNFHPYHILPEAYPKDEAYHNGTVWGWLAGPVITSLMKYGYSDLSFELLFSESFQITNWGAAGALSELLNAIPPEGWDIPETSGTVTQAWSLAEYIRNVYQDVIGIHPNVPERKIRIAPHLPGAMEYLSCKIPVPDSELKLSIEQNQTECIYKLSYAKGKSPWKIEFEHPVSPTTKSVFSYDLRSDDTLTAHISFIHPETVALNGQRVETQINRVELDESLFGYLSFAFPQLDKNLNYLKPLPYPLLTGAQIKSWNPTAKKLCDLECPERDDTGPNGKYTYPTGSFFKEGIFDLTKFQFLEDERNYYFKLRFRELVQPGWHPEYGFQLTFAAIAINQGLAVPGSVKIGRNANELLPPNFAYHAIIYIGGGIQMEDNAGAIILAHRPHDIQFRLGDILNKEVSFSIPKNYFRTSPETWKIAILVGGQDDHGGSGLGEFRSVVKEANAWQGGGGAEQTGNSNVYDSVFIDMKNKKPVSVALHRQ